MEKIRFYKDGDSEYFTSRGRWCKYFFDHNETLGLIIIGETDDYFYFTLSLREGVLKDKLSITIDDKSLMYEHFDKLISGFKLIDVFEEGTPEQKSLCLQKLDHNIQIDFNLTSDEKVFCTIEFANLRRLGDTRFKNIIKQNGVFGVEDEREFRYKFKVRLHNMMDDLQRLYKQNQIQQI